MMYKSDPETLVDHLRDIYANKWGVVTKPLPSPLCAAAADEIERLRALVAANDELRKAAEEVAAWWRDPKEESIGCYPGLNEKFEALCAELDKGKP
jgi:hypothetical protein